MRDVNAKELPKTPESSLSLSLSLSLLSHVNLRSFWRSMDHSFPRRPPPPPPGPPPPPYPSLDRLIQLSLDAYVSGNDTSTSAASGNGKVPEKGTLAAVASSIKRCVAGMSRWDISDLTLGLYKIATRHALEGATDTISGSPVVNKRELKELLHWLDWAWASYESDQKSIISSLKIKETQLKKHTNTSAILKPAYFIAVDDDRRCVIVSIRGTYAATDVLTDLQPHSEKFEGGYAHSGMLSAAGWLLQNEIDTLQILLRENPGYRLVLTGHSLGAGTASLLCFLLRESCISGNKNISSRLGVPFSMIDCWGFGCPPCVDKSLAEEASFIKNIVCQDDIIARASAAALEDLRSEILQTDWAHILEDGGTARKMVELVKTSYSSLENVEQALGYERGTFYEQAKRFLYTSMVDPSKTSMFRAQYGMHGSPMQYDMHGPPMQYGMHGYRGPYGMNGPPGSYGMPGPQAHYGMHEPPPRNLFGWLSLGVAAFSSSLTSLDKQNQVQAATPSGEMSDAATNTSREFMESGRLFVPGVLYHINRKPIQEEELPSLTGSNSSNLVVEMEGLSLGEEKTTELQKHDKFKTQERKAKTETSKNQERKAKTETGKGPVAARHFVVRGSDPASRFKKIVLSKSMLSDHSLLSYKEGIQDTIRWTAESPPVVQ